MAVEAGDIVWRIVGDIEGLNRAMGDAQRDIEAKFGQISRTAGIAMTAVGGAITGAFGVAIYEANSFQAAMAEVATLGVKDLDGLGDSVKDVAVAYGLDLTDSVKGLYQAISAGASELQAPLLLEKAAKAATAGVSDLATSIELGTSVSNAFGKSLEDINTIYDQAFIAVKNGVTTFEELSSSVGKVSPLFSAAGLSSAEMFASLTALTKGGLATTEAVTGMKAALTNVIKPTSEAAKVAEDLGIQFDATSLKTLGLEGFMRMVSDAADGNIEVLSKLFPSVEALNAVLALTGNQAESFSAALEEMNSTTGATDRAFKAFADASPEFAFKQLQAAVSALAVEVGQALLPILRDFSRDIVPIIQSMIDWIREHETLTKWVSILGAAFGAFMLTVGPLLIMLPGMISLFSLLKGAFVWLTGAIWTSVPATVAETEALGAAGIAGTAAATGVGGAALAIEASGMAAMMAAPLLLEYTTIIMGTGAAWATAGAATTAALLPAGAAVATLAGETAAAGAVIDVTATAVVAAAGETAAAGGIIGTAFAALASIPLWVIGLILAAVIGLSVAIYYYWDEIAQFSNDTWIAISEAFTAAWDSVVEALPLIWETIKSVIGAALEEIGFLVGFAVGLIVRLFTDPVGLITDLWTGLVATFNLVMSTITDATMAGIALITQGWTSFTALLGTLWQGASTMFQSVWDVISSTFATAAEFILGVVMHPVETLYAAWDSMVGFFQAVWDGIVSVFRAGVDAAMVVLGPLLDAVQWVGGKLGAGFSAGYDASGAGFPAFADGGVMPSSGWAMVGERGPELVQLPGGSRVHNAQDTAAMASSQPMTININFGRDSVRSDEDIRAIEAGIANVVGNQLRAVGVSI